MRAAFNRSAIVAGGSLLAHAALVVLWLRRDPVIEPVKATVKAPAQTHGSTVKVSIYGGSHATTVATLKTQAEHPSPALQKPLAAPVREGDANRVANDVVPAAPIDAAGNEDAAANDRGPAAPAASEKPGASSLDALPGNAVAAASDIPEDIKRLLHDQLQASAVQCYPAAAKRFGSRGTSKVSFCVHSLHADKIELQQSSGSSLLDDAAQHCVMSDIDNFLGMVPVSLEGHCFAFPVAFGQ